jgi:predicted nucleic acid-binding protein
VSLVVSDASPLHYLILTGAVDVLPRLFDKVVIPKTISDELQHSRTPMQVQQWISAIPNWAEIQAGTRIMTPIPIDRGEQEAIGLALELKADALLVDDRDARRAAIANGIIVLGTLGVLELAGDRGLLDLPETLDRLRTTNFRASETLFEMILARWNRRRRD